MGFEQFEHAVRQPRPVREISNEQSRREIPEVSMPILTSIAASKFVITSVTAGTIALGGGAAAFTNITSMEGSNQPSVSAPAQPETPKVSPSPSSPSAPVTTAPDISALAPATAAPVVDDAEKFGDDVAAGPAKPAPAVPVTPALSAPSVEAPRPVPVPSQPAAAMAPSGEHDDADSVDAWQQGWHKGQHKGHHEGRQGEGRHHEGRQGEGRHHEGHGQND
jgi:hypothetical protein